MFPSAIVLICRGCAERLVVGDEIAALRCARCGMSADDGVLEFTHWYQRVRVAEERWAFAGTTVERLEFGDIGHGRELGALILRCRRCGAPSGAGVVQFKDYARGHDRCACPHCEARAGPEIVREFFAALTHCVDAAQKFCGAFEWRP